MSEHETIFKTEEKILEHAQSILDDEQYEHNPLMSEFDKLFENYKKIYKNLKSLVKISDSHQNRLNILNKKLTYQARIDTLTGASNRRYFIERAEKELRRAKRYNHPISFMMIDIDHFKKINDTYGHQNGDEALKHMTRVCLKTLRANDLFGRIGG